MNLEKIFLTVFNMSLTGSYVILAIIVLRFCMKKAPKWINYILWVVPALRLILPISFKSELSVFSLIPDSNITASEIIYTNTPAVRSGVTYMNTVVNPVITESMEVSSNTGVNPIIIVSIIWLLGIALLITYITLSYFITKKRLSEAVLLRDNIYQSEKIVSPFLFGIIKPRIYIPYIISDEQLRYVVSHENAHIKRRDYLAKPIAFIIAALHWFNPIVWIAYILFCRDTELSCDEKVVKNMDINERKGYSKTLIHFAAKSNTLPACPVAFGEVSIKNRVKKALSYKKPLLWIIILAFVICTVAVICLLSNPINNTQNISITDEFSQLYGTYHPDKLIYLSPLSSYYPTSFDCEPYYTFSEHKFSYILPIIGEEEIFEIEYEITDLTKDELDNMLFIDFGFAGAYNLNDKNIQQIIISEEYRLFIADSELWIASFAGDEIWSIYRLMQVSEPYLFSWVRKDNRMTMGELKELVKLKDNNLTWRDFNEYEHYMVGSGLFIWHVPVDDNYCVRIGGWGLGYEPMYVNLMRLDSANQITDDRLDLLSDYFDLQGFHYDSSEELTWWYIPYISSVYPALPINIFIPYDTVSVAIDNGSLCIHNDTETKNVGIEYTYKHGDTIYWSPMPVDKYDEKDAASSCEMQITIVDKQYQGEVVYNCKVYIEATRDTWLYSISLEDQQKQLEISKDYNSRYGFLISRYD